MSRWQQIETAPKWDRVLLVWMPDGDIRIGYLSPTGWVFHDYWRVRVVQPTHWMPLPEPPR